MSNGNGNERAATFDAVFYCAQILCVACLPEGITLNDEEVSPIFADSEWDYVPLCDKCGKEHSYITIVDAEL